MPGLQVLISAVISNGIIYLQARQSKSKRVRDQTLVVGHSIKVVEEHQMKLVLR